MADAGPWGPNDVAEWLRSTVLTALTSCGAPPISTSYVAAGQIAYDDCCGTLVVAPERTFRSAVFPIEGTTDANCYEGLIVLNMVVLLLRCVPVLDSGGNPPTAAQLNDAYAAVLWEAGVVWDAMSGPLPTGDVSGALWERSALAQSYVGAEGGCIGVETRVTLGVDREDWCGCVPAP